MVLPFELVPWYTPSITGVTAGAGLPPPQPERASSSVRGNAKGASNLNMKSLSFVAIKKDVAAPPYAWRSASAKGLASTLSGSVQAESSLTY
jgi:hypothetical protein